MNKKKNLSTLTLKNSFSNAINNFKNVWVGLKCMAYSKQSKMSTVWYEKSLKMEYYTMSVFVGGWWKFVYFVKHEHWTKDVHWLILLVVLANVSQCCHFTRKDVARWSSMRWPGQTTWSHKTQSHTRQQKGIVLRNLVERDFWIAKVRLDRHNTAYVDRAAMPRNVWARWKAGFSLLLLFFFLAARRTIAGIMASHIVATAVTRYVRRTAN